MEKVILNEEALYHGYVKCPKGYEIDREQIKYQIMKGYIRNRDSLHNRYEVEHTKELNFFDSYINDFFSLKHEGKLNLVFKNRSSFILKEGEKRDKRNDVNVFDIPGSPVYTLIYGIELEDFSSDLIIHYKYKKTPNRIWRIPLENNKFIIFPSHLNYEITKNNSKLNSFYLMNYYFEV